jgi:WD40 repeat protein
MARALLLLALLLPADITPKGELFRPPSARLVGTLKVGGGTPISSFHYSRDGRSVTVLTTDGKLSVWDIATRRRLRQMPGTFIVNRFQVSADGTRALAGGADRRSVRLVDLERGVDLRTFTDARAGSLYSFSLSPDGRKVAYFKREGTVRLHDAESGEELGTLAEAGPQQSLAWSPDGRTMALQSAGDFTVRFHDTAGWEPKGSFTDRGATPLYMGFTPDSSGFVHIGVDAKMKVIDRSGRLVKLFDEQVTGSRHVAFSRDGRWMAVSEINGKVRIWETKTWKAVRDLAAPAARHVAFSPDGRHLALAMENGIQLWGGVGPASIGVSGDGARDGKPGFLGIQGSMEDDEDAGVVIQDVIPGTGAERAGLKSGDRIVKIGGAASENFEALRSIVTTLREGDEVEVVYLRAGAEHRVKVKLGSRPEE